jgi:hypothetical protein
MPDESRAQAWSPDFKPQSVPPQQRDTGWRSILASRWMVLSAIFLAMMFLGIPLLWMSPAFSRAERIFWTIATLVYSALIIWAFVWIMMWCWSRIFPAL